MIQKKEQEACIRPPRHQAIIDFNASCANNDIDAILDYFTDDASWEMVGGATLHGKSEIQSFMMQAQCPPVQEVVIDKIITHGKYASANGTLFFKNGDLLHFSDIYTFSGSSKRAKIQSLQSYAIETKVVKKRK